MNKCMCSAGENSLPAGIVLSGVPNEKLSSQSRACRIAA